MVFSCAEMSFLKFRQRPPVGPISAPQRGGPPQIGFAHPPGSARALSGKPGGGPFSAVRFTNPRHRKVILRFWGLRPVGAAGRRAAASLPREDPPGTRVRSRKFPGEASGWSYPSGGSRWRTRRRNLRLQLRGAAAQGRPLQSAAAAASGGGLSKPETTVGSPRQRRR
jgi:hypothetical protein